MSMAFTGTSSMLAAGPVGTETVTVAVGAAAAGPREEHQRQTQREEP